MPWTDIKCAYKFTDWMGNVKTETACSHIFIPRELYELDINDKDNLQRLLSYLNQEYIAPNNGEFIDVF